VGFETLPPGISDEDAIARAQMLWFGGFEIWDGARFVVGRPPSAETLAPISRGHPALMDDRTRRDARGLNWPSPA
jgi:hypothetical protein